MLCFTMGFIAGALVVLLMVLASDRWKLWPKPRPIFAPRAERLLLEVPFLSLDQLHRLSETVLGPSLAAIGRGMYWNQALQPDERIRLAVTLEKFGP